MVVSVVTVLTGSGTAQEVIDTTNVVEVLNSQNVLVPGTSGIATEVVKPGGTVANVAFGSSLPPAPVEGQIFILTQDPIAPSRVFVSDTDPGLTEPGLWWQTLPGGGLTLWIEDGT